VGVSSFADEYVANGHRRILLLCRTAKYRKKSPICSWFVLNSDRLLGPQLQIETNSILLLPRLIAETSLLSLTSTRNLGHGEVGAHLERLDIETTTMRRQLGGIHRKDQYLSPAAMKFVTILSEMGGSLLEPSPTGRAGTLSLAHSGGC
ncbi:MAG TPA: hypothetical protein VJY39_15900, partial [Acidisphaera sp.]|nr:hypothetical protein [Acidisphaera sp.]